MQKYLAAAALSALLVPQAALAGKSEPRHIMPPEGYKGQWWTDPTGCRYSRAGAPGELVWFLAGPPSPAGCWEYIVQKRGPNTNYRAPYWQTPN